MFSALFIGLACMFLYLLCRGGDEAFGQFMGVFLAIAFIGAIVVFGGGFILLFALPLLLVIGAPLIFLAAAATIVARFLNALGSEKSRDCTNNRKREE